MVRLIELGQTPERDPLADLPEGIRAGIELARRRREAARPRVRRTM